MTARVIPDDGADRGDSATTLDAFKFPKPPRDLTLDQAAELWADIEANEALPGHVKDALGQRINARLDEIAGRTKAAKPAPAMTGVWFHRASPADVEAGLKALAKERPKR